MFVRGETAHTVNAGIVHLGGGARPLSVRRHPGGDDLGARERLTLIRVSHESDETGLRRVLIGRTGLGLLRAHSRAHEADCHQSAAGCV